MKRLIAALLASVGMVQAFAKGPAPEGAALAGGLVAYDEMPRVLIFGDTFHRLSADGEIQVCKLGNKTAAEGAAAGKCLNAAGASAWQSAASAAPKGFRLAAYEYRLVNVYWTLVLYFAPQ